LFIISLIPLPTNQAIENTPKVFNNPVCTDLDIFSKKLILQLAFSISSAYHLKLLLAFFNSCCNQIIACLACNVSSCDIHFIEALKFLIVSSNLAISNDDAFAHSPNLFKI